MNWLETQYPSPAFPSRRTDTDPAREQPQYYAAYAILTGSFPVTKNVQQRVGEADPQGIDDMMRRVRLIPSHTQALFAPRVTIHTRDGERKYADLVAECRQIDHAADVARLIALTCPPDRPSRGQA